MTFLFHGTRKKWLEKVIFLQGQLVATVYLNNNNAQQQQGTDVHAHLLKRTFGIVFFFAQRSGLDPC